MTWRNHDEGGGIDKRKARRQRHAQRVSVWLPETDGRTRRRATIGGTASPTACTTPRTEPGTRGSAGSHLWYLFLHDEQVREIQAGGL
jgi:hypothetical protein